MSEEDAVLTGQREEIASADGPELRTAVLNGMGIPRRHEGLETGKIGEESGLAGEHLAALASDVAKGAEGMIEIGVEAFTNLLLDADTDDQQAGRGKPKRD